MLLTFGVALVQLPSRYSIATSNEGSLLKYLYWAQEGSTEIIRHKIFHVKEEMNRALGITVVFAACLLSGLTGVYFEKVLKGSNKTIWLRNVQLSFFSLFPAFFMGVLWKDGYEVRQKVFDIHIIRANCIGIFPWI